MKNLRHMKWLFFDIGSTIVDETECYKSRIDEITRTNNIDKAAFCKKVRECAKTNAYAIKAAAGYYNVHVPKWNSDLECLYPDAENVLQILSQKYKLGVIANQTVGTAVRLENRGIKKYFDVIVASAEAGYAKPDLEIFNIAIHESGCNPNEAVMIGDRLDNDILPAKSLGMSTVWIKQGFAVYQSVKAQEEKPDFEVDSLTQLLRLF